jgi:hypothetical protein
LGIVQSLPEEEANSLEELEKGKMPEPIIPFQNQQDE